MELSRRAALRAGTGLLAAGGLAGCIERRVTRRETRVRDSASWALNPDVGAALDEDEFESYVEEMADEYGDSGVRGLDGQPGEDFETAYVQRLGVPQDGPGESDLVPEAVDLESPLLVADAAVAVYAVDDDRYRYWLWAAADGTADRLVRDVEVSILSVRLSFRDTELVEGAQVSTDDGEAQVTLGSPPEGRFPLNGTTRDVETTVEPGEGGTYFVDWSGGVEGAQSVNGVCEEERDGEHDFFWGIAAGYTRTEQT